MDKSLNQFFFLSPPLMWSFFLHTNPGSTADLALCIMPADFVISWILSSKIWEIQHPSPQTRTNIFHHDVLQFIKLPLYLTHLVYILACWVMSLQKSTSTKQTHTIACGYAQTGNTNSRPMPQKHEEKGEEPGRYPSRQEIDRGHLHVHIQLNQWQNKLKSKLPLQPSRPIWNVSLG